MNKLPPSSKYVQRAGDAVDEVERDALTRRVSDAYAEGRMELAEYQDAMQVIYQAKTLGELVPVVETLPAPIVDTPAIVGTGHLPAGQVNVSRPPSNIVLIGLAAAGGAVLLLFLIGLLAGLLLW
ncbi:MAG: DUF1707 domain-containing protein [Propionibacteriaceae bacterium]|nr:DUF1707 domain-containing protein [Propionibacteriaceae bacterium]